MAKAEVIDKVTRYVRLVIQEGIPIQYAFLYGSHARDEANEESDIDVLLVSPAFDEWNIKIAGKVWGLTPKVDARIEPYITGSKKFQTDDVSPLFHIVRREGIEIKP